jgi:signal transduction histidine kinase
VWPLEVVQQALKTCHDIAHGLSPVDPESGGLVAALGALRVRLSGPPGPVVDLAMDHAGDAMLSSDYCNHLYRIAQEAASNAIKHAAATHIRISMQISAGAVRLEIADDGCGLKSGAETSGRLGLHTMRDRAASMGGTFNVSSAPGRGTQIVCEVPLSTARSMRKRKT